MSETRATYDAGGVWPSAEDRQQASRLRAIFLELDAMRNALPNDGPHNRTFNELGHVLSALERAEQSLLEDELGEE